MNYIPKSTGGRIAALVAAFFLYVVIHSALIKGGVISAPVAQAVLGEHPKPGYEASEAGGVTMRNFQRLETGMSYKGAAHILGQQGEEVSSNDIAGIKTIMYQWKAGSMANMNAMFQNDKLISKAQIGLE